MLQNIHNDSFIQIQNGSTNQTKVLNLKAGLSFYFKSLCKGFDIKVP